MNIFCGTWNVNGRRLSNEDYGLQEWLFPTRGEFCDVYAIGLQEIVDLTVVNVMLSSRTADEAANYWIETISQVLKEFSIFTYKLVVERHMVGILIAIFVR
jgi:phosphatidylinositol-bisphosphatase